MEREEIQTQIPLEAYAPEGSMDLDTTYELSVNEMGLQQTKRDQIIAFYLTILGFVIPNVIGMEVNDIAKAVAFFTMYGIGVIFCHVVLRYRVYKEVYWIACRVITQLFNIKKECIDKEVIYTLFYHNLEKNIHTIVRKNRAGKSSLLCSFKRQLNSAETLLYETLVLFASFVGAIGVFYLWKDSVVGAVIAALLIIFEVLRMNYKYSRRLMDLYTCVETGKRSDLEKTFAKAWMLQCYVDDIIKK